MVHAPARQNGHDRLPPAELSARRENSSRSSTGGVLLPLRRRPPGLLIERLEAAGARAAEISFPPLPRSHCSLPAGSSGVVVLSQDPAARRPGSTLAGGSPEKEHLIRCPVMI
jgi:hypothetical protein